MIYLICLYLSFLNFGVTCFTRGTDTGLRVPTPRWSSWALFQYKCERVSTL